MGNLLVELGPERADKSLMLMAYAMTHPANRMPNPYAGELIEDAAGAHVRGRGVSEQKGSLAAALAAVKTAADRLPLRGRLVFTVSTAGETGRHDAAISICDALGFAPTPRRDRDRHHQPGRARQQGPRRCHRHRARQGFAQQHAVGRA